jgi:hypothetical protein
MPKKKANKSKSKKQSRTMRNNSMSSAPAAVSDFLTQSVKFKPSKGGKGLIMEVCLPLCDITGTTFTTGSRGVLTPQGTSFDALTVNPVLPIGGTSSTGEMFSGSVVTSYINPAWSLISAAFTRWKIRKLIFKYRPQSTSTLADQLVFAFAADPSHSLIGLLSTGILTNSSLLNVGDSIPFMPWMAWDMDVSSTLRTESELFMADKFSVDDVMDTRFSQAGVFTCTHGTSQATPIVYGVLYGCAEFELLEFCPITTVDATAFFPEAKQRMVESSIQFLELQRQNRILEEEYLDVKRKLKQLDEDEELITNSNCDTDMEVYSQSDNPSSTYRSELKPRKVSVTRVDFKRQV